LLVDGLNLNKLPSKEQVRTLFVTELQCTLYVCDDRYDAGDGTTKNMVKHIPDGVCVIFSSVGTGDLVYTWTPEEISAELGGEVDFSVVNTGIVVTAETSKDIVQTVTKVSMSTLLDFPGADTLAIFTFPMT
jgi:hypothetical protein